MASKVKTNHKESFLSGIIKENPLFVSVLGTCPALAVTKTFEAAFGMGLLFLFVLVCSNVLISLLRKIIPEEIETPCYIVVIATFVTIVKMFCNAFLPELYSSLGVFLSLLVVNCIVLGRAEAFANKNTVFDSFLDGLGNGIGYTMAICIMAIVREILGTGMLTFGATFTFLPYVRIPFLKYVVFDAVKNADVVIYDYSISIFQNPAGAFIVFGIILAIIAAVENHKKAVALARRKKAAFAAKAAPAPERSAAL